MKMTREDGSVNVAAMARKICGIKSGKPVSKMTVEEKHNFWNVSKAFANRKYFRDEHAAKTGYGMKLIEKFVMNSKKITGNK